MKLNPLELFISYSHADKTCLEEFIRALSPLKNSGKINIWWDGENIGGSKFQPNIDSHVKNSDIICLLISNNFFSSSPCLEERDKALELKKIKAVSIIPIIISSCDWKTDEKIASLLALPNDAKPVNTFRNNDEGWIDVIEGLKIVVEEMIKFKQVKISTEFQEFLNGTDLLSYAHPNKTNVLLDDIFVYPELSKNNFEQGGNEEKIDSHNLIDNFENYHRITISGESQSGKTTLCKKMFIELHKKGLFPIYLSYSEKSQRVNIENKLKKAFGVQYDDPSFFEYIQKFDPSLIIPIIDDFHYNDTKKEKDIIALDKYKNQIIIVDDIFNLDFVNEQLIKSFNQFKIKEFNNLLKNKLIEKWIYLTENTEMISHFIHNDHFGNLDNKTELVNNTLFEGIMPAYPFFILSIIIHNETLNDSLSQEITSQGHCYQALIYFYLKKQGVENEDVGTYLNFLTEFAFFLFINKKEGLSKLDFEEFIKKYRDEFHLTVKIDILMKVLFCAKIIHFDSFSNCSFSHKYIYYFYIAKYLADNIDKEENRHIINSIINNLHKDENAYIAIFISHHSKNTYILNEIKLNSMCLFDGIKEATLEKSELSFFDTEINNVIKVVLSPENKPSQERESKLLELDSIKAAESDKKNKEENLTNENSKENLDLINQLRKSIKTVEVMGIIIKNRAGSIQKNEIIELFEFGMDNHLRILSSFLEYLRKLDSADMIIEFLKKRLEFVIKNESKKPDDEELKKIIRKIYWGLNLGIVLGIINKIIHSLGSNKLTQTIEEICNKKNTPVALIIKHGILMWYAKNLKIDEVHKELKNKNFSLTARKIIEIMISEHCLMHSIGYKEKQKIEKMIGIPIKKGKT